ncbi:mitochondrial metalloendopeptidase OMA1-like [Triticum dicoccoides]|uniref:mitochondrial metalloendopeptidase OMA1-like n=1 Tax=Triticum dicoccoides TaxID=85692 RepID=UPI001891EF97|nr:mitochondrial metalloendopeptidase OMA1-like [Triticum dicoccoides]
MCAPGGKIIVYTGLLDKFSTDAEIATVLGHEVAHAIARHTAEGLTKHMWILMLTVFLGIFIDEPKMIDKLAKYLLSLPFSRKYDGDRGGSHWNPAARCRWFRSTHSP